MGIYTWSIRQTDRYRDRERQTVRDRDTQRQRNRERNTHRDTETETQRQRHRDSKRERQTEIAYPQCYPSRSVDSKSSVP